MVFGFAVAVFCFTQISSRPAWYHCSFRVRGGGIRLRPNLITSRHAIIVVFSFTVAVFGFALITSHPAWYRCGIGLRCGGIRLRSNLFTPGVVSLRYSASLYFSGVLQVVVSVPVHGCREIDLWREIIHHLIL